MKRKTKLYGIISDIHERRATVEKIIDRIKYSVDKIILLGDYFDSHISTTLSDFEKYCYWLKNLQKSENVISLLGNHDIQYFTKHQNLLQRYLCSGYNHTKREIVQFIFKSEYPRRFLFYEEKSNILFSHAGLQSHLIPSVNNFNFSKEYFEEMNNKILSRFEAGIEDIPFLGAGVTRGGLQTCGGIVWCDWNVEFQPVPNLNQMVGHTISEFVRTRNGSNSTNWCLDTALKNFAILDTEINEMIIVKTDEGENQNV